MMNLIFIAVFILAVGLGALQGMLRKVGKARIRGISVLACAILAVVLAALTKGLWVSEGTLDFILAEMGETKIFTELMDASPALCGIVLKFLASLVAPLLCLVYFILLCFITWIAYLIVTLILAKQIREHSEKCSHSKLRGAIWGGVQGLAVFVILMVPFAAYLDVAAPAVEVILEADVLDDSTEDTVEGIMDDFVTPVNDGTLMVYRTVGGGLIVNAITDFSVDDLAVDFIDEIDSLISLGCNVIQLTQNELADFGEAEANAVDAIADSFEDSVLLSTITGDFIYGATDSWINDRPFLGVKMPKTGDLFDPFLNVLVEILHDDARSFDALQADIHTVADMFSTLAQHRVFANLNNVDRLMTTLSSNGIVSDLVTSLGNNNSMKRLIPEITNLGVRAIASTLGVPADTAEVYGDLLDDIAREVNKAKSMPESQRADHLTQQLKNAFDEAGVPVDEEILVCYSVSMIEDLVNDNTKFEIEPTDIQAFFEIYAVNFEEGTLPISGGSVPLASKKPVALGNESDRFVGTVYEGKTEEELKKTGAAVLGVTYKQLTVIAVESGDAFKEQAITVVMMTYSELITVDSENMKALEGFKMETKPSDSSVQAAASLKTSETLVTQKILMTDLLIDSKIAADGLNAGTLSQETAAITEIFNAASDLSKQFNNNSNDISVDQIAGSVGQILDSLADSNSYGGDKTASLFTAVLQSETVRNTANIDMKTATQMAQKATEDNPNYSQTMSVVSNTVTVMTELSKENGELTEDQLIELIRSINRQSAAMLEVYATPERIESYNVPAEYAGITSDLITKTFHFMATANMSDAEYEKEAKALNQLLNVAFGAKTDSGLKYLFAKDGRPSVLPGTADEMIATFMASHAISAALRETVLDANGKIREDRNDPFDIGANLPDDSTDMIDGIAAAQRYYEENRTEEVRLTLYALAALLGISDNLTF